MLLMYKHSIIAVLGAKGMLGRAVIEEAKQRGYEVLALDRRHCNIADVTSVAWALRDIKDADWIINCAGIRPEVGAPDRDMLAVNALGPHNLAHFTRYLPNVKVLHVSTDCVFSGAPTVFRHTTTSRPDPIDLYGRSKLAGEVDAPHIYNIRTSFVGPEHGLWKWLATAKERGQSEIPGWTTAFWSGSTVWAVASALVDMTEVTPKERLVHLATAQTISKYDALIALRAHIGTDVSIYSTKLPRIHRGLVPTEGHILPSLAESLKERELTEIRALSLKAAQS
jgi:dTDP-4-dehydrorhamnose reductase